MDSPLFSSYLKKTKVEKPKFQDIPLNEDIEEDKEIYRFTSNIETSYQVDKNKIIHQDTYRFSKVGFNLGKILDNTENFQANGFACGDVLPDDFGFPTLKVKIGEKLKQVSLPLTEKKQADELIKVFTKAPFGHGVETKLDEKIRKTWQLEPEDFQLGGKKWDTNLTNLIEQHIKPGLGIPKNQKVCSSIYKLLLYEKDGHFDYHRDTEKAERMFATLTIMLPSVFTDGHLIVKQDDNEKVFKYEEESVAYYTAFYCDCEHKVTPVTSGYRMCAVYNLCFEDENSVVESRRFEKMYAELETLVNQWIAKPEKPLFSYMLQHAYSSKSLTKSNLKGNDIFVYKFLEEYNLKCKPENKLVFELGLFKRQDSGDAEVYISSDDSENGHSKQYALSTVEEDIQLFDTSMKIKTKTMGYRVLASDFVPNTKFKNAMSTSCKITRYGNDGVQFDMIYESGCLVIYPSCFSKNIKLIKKEKDYYDFSIRDEFERLEKDPNLKEELIIFTKAMMHSTHLFTFSSIDRKIESVVKNLNDQSLNELMEKFNPSEKK